MFEGSDVFFSKMIGTLAVILVVAASVGGSDLLSKFRNEKRKWQYPLVAGLLGGIFGIYGNISGVSLDGAIISVRDIGPMLAGFTGGPLGGLAAGLIAGVHRLTMGGITAKACVVATCCIGVFCGLILRKWQRAAEKPQYGLLVGAMMEAMAAISSREKDGMLPGTKSPPSEARPCMMAPGASVRISPERVLIKSIKTSPDCKQMCFIRILYTSRRRL